MIVVDASAVLEVLFGQPPLTERVLGSGHTLHCPELLDLEVAQALRRYVRTSDLTVRRADQALDDLRGIPLERYPQEPLLGRIWQLRVSLTAYDAAYVALAEVLRAPLVTCDSRLSRAHGHRARIDLYPPSVVRPAGA